MIFPFDDIKRNMQELDSINTLLGGHAITIAGFKQFYKKNDIQIITVCEIGCGGGDNLKAIYKYCRKKKLPVKLTGIDINPECISYAKENCASIPGIEFIASDYRLVDFNNKPDLLFSSLFTHHLDDSQYKEMLEWSAQHAAKGFFINDLHRHFLAYYSIKFLTATFSKSYLVKNDAPLSVSRGFLKKELQTLFEATGIANYTIRWKWAFRWLITVKK
jgi:SAM-dependent methyltransferase